MLHGKLRLFIALASAPLILGCGSNANHSSVFDTPISPTALGTGDTAAVGTPDVPFHSELAWRKVEGTQISLCTHPLPAGKMYLMRNTITATALSTHLGAGDYLGHTCVYGTAAGPEGWFSDVRWTAANGDVLLANAVFRQWTGVPGKSVAIEDVTFVSGGTGRFEIAEGQAICHVDAPGRSAVYAGALRYGKKEK
jgi:hypothetical protein